MLRSIARPGPTAASLPGRALREKRHLSSDSSFAWEAGARASAAPLLPRPGRSVGSTAGPGRSARPARRTPAPDPAAPGHCRPPARGRARRERPGARRWPATPRPRSGRPKTRPRWPPRASERPNGRGVARTGPPSRTLGSLRRAPSGLPRKWVLRNRGEGELRLGQGRIARQLYDPACQGPQDLALHARILVDELPEVLARQHEEAQRRLRGDGRRPPRLLEQRDLPEEVAGRARRQPLAITGDLDLPLDDHEELLPDLALLAEHLAGRDLEILAHPRELDELLTREACEQGGPLERLHFLVLGEKPHARSLFSAARGVEPPGAAARRRRPGAIMRAVRTPTVNEATDSIA